MYYEKFYSLTSTSRSYLAVIALVVVLALTLKYEKLKSGSVGLPQDRAQALSALPNPAREQVAFRYQLPDPQQPGQLHIYDVQGKHTATLGCGPGTAQQIWRTAGQQRGLYYCILQQGAYRSPALKVLLIKKMYCCISKTARYSR